MGLRGPISRARPKKAQSAISQLVLSPHALLAPTQAMIATTQSSCRLSQSQSLTKPADLDQAPDFPPLTWPRCTMCRVTLEEIVVTLGISRCRIAEEIECIFIVFRLRDKERTEVLGWGYVERKFFFVEQGLTKRVKTSPTRVRRREVGSPSTRDRGDPYYSLILQETRLAKFQGRKPTYIRYVDLTWLAEQNFSFPHDMEAQGTVQFLELKGQVYPALVREFYANFRYKDGK
ncbi:hypothetical protein Lal_00035277 [Lupinus albus]|nr:hypothetical protein Lal_00035277 [Lupinus albus]